MLVNLACESETGQIQNPHGSTCSWDMELDGRHAHVDNIQHCLDAAPNTMDSNKFFKTRQQYTRTPEGQVAHIYVQIFVSSVSKHQVMSHGDSMGFHGMLRPIVKVRNISCSKWQTWDSVADSAEQWATREQQPSRTRSLVHMTLRYSRWTVSLHNPQSRMTTGTYFQLRLDWGSQQSTDSGCQTLPYDITVVAVWNMCTWRSCSARTGVAVRLDELARVPP